jgi:cytochrome b561
LTDHTSPSDVVTGPGASPAEKYPLPMRGLHWLRALLIFGQIWAGLTMVSLPDSAPAKFKLFYPYHKSFGILVLIVALAQLGLRAASAVPPLPGGLARWEVKLSKFVQRSIYVLLVLVPLAGYAMSSTYTQSDGVFFFGAYLPEVLPKNDRAFEVFRLVHRLFAYILLALVTVHALGALKHRFLDRDRANDVLRRML